MHAFSELLDMLLWEIGAKRQGGRLAVKMHVLLRNDFVFQQLHQVKLMRCVPTGMLLQKMNRNAFISPAPFLYAS